MSQVLQGSFVQERSLWFLTGLRFGAAVYKTGRREGGIVLYEADMYPSACIGPVQFLWRPQAVSDEVSRLSLDCAPVWVCSVCDFFAT